MTIEQLDAQYADRYEPLITLNEAAAIARCPLATIYDWSSRGLFNRFKVTRGRRRLLQRSEFVRFLMENKNS